MCLIDYIGLDGCNGEAVGGVAPASGLWVNQLAGISLKRVDKVSNTYARLWNDIQVRAWRKFKQDVLVEVRKRFKVTQLKNSFHLRFDIDSTSTTDGTLRGFRIDTSRGMDTYEHSAMLMTNVQTLYLYLDSLPTKDVDLYIYDLKLSTELWSTTLVEADQVVGWNTIKVDEVFDSLDLFCCFDSTDVTTRDKVLRDSRHEFPTYIYGAESAIPLSDITEGTNTFGLSGVFGIRCMVDSLICNNKDVFTQAWWYLLGSEIMSEVLSSDRFNEYTTLLSDQARELKMMYDIEYMGGMKGEKEIKGALYEAVGVVDLDQSDYCVECNEQSTVREVWL